MKTSVRIYLNLFVILLRYVKIFIFQYSTNFFNSILLFYYFISNLFDIKVKILLQLAFSSKAKMIKIPNGRKS